MHFLYGKKYINSISTRNHYLQEKVLLIEEKQYKINYLYIHTAQNTNRKH
jgi:hypothetical protein